MGKADKAPSYINKTIITKAHINRLEFSKNIFCYYKFKLNNRINK